MANEKRLIDANKIPYHQSGFPKGDGFDSGLDWAFREDIEKLPTVDAVEVDVIRAWLYEIAMNNTNNPLCDACEEIISRLGGLVAFARERKDDG